VILVGIVKENDNDSSLYFVVVCGKTSEI